MIGSRGVGRKYTPSLRTARRPQQEARQHFCQRAIAPFIRMWGLVGSMGQRSKCGWVERTCQAKKLRYCAAGRTLVYWVRQYDKKPGGSQGRDEA